MGVKVCGLFKWFLDLMDLEFVVVVKKVEEFIEDFKKIMLIFGVFSFKDLK